MSCDSKKLVPELERKCSRLQKQIDDMVNERTSTEKKAIEIMQRLVDTQKSHYEAELNSLKGQLIEQTKYIESLERGKSSVLARAKNLEQEVIQRRNELQSAASKITELNENLKIADEKTETTVDITTRSLLEEISKIKNQKAELRVKCMVLERENFRLKELKAPDTSEIEKETVAAANKEMARLEIQLVVTKDKLTETSNTCEQTKGEKEQLEERLRQLLTDKENLRRSLDNAKREKNEKISISDALKEDFEKKIVDLTQERDALKEALEECDAQCEQLLDVQRNDKLKNDELSDEISRLQKNVTKLEANAESFKDEASKEKKERERIEQKLTFSQEELEATHKDYREELSNFSRLIASEKGISSEYVSQMEAVKNSKRDLETQLHLIETMFQESIKEKRLLEQKLLESESQLSQLIEKHHEKGVRAKEALEEAISKCERYKRDCEQVKAERNSFENLYQSTKQSLEMDIMKQNATILQHQKLVTHLQTQLIPQKRRCILCLDSKTNPNALTPEKLEELLDEYRRRNTDLSTNVRALEASLKEEKAKNVVKSQQRDIVGRDIAIIKKTDSFSSSISTGTSSREGTMRHNIPHRWVKHFVTKRTKCMACMEDLPFSRHCAKCQACKTTVHHSCAESLMNTCGLPMLYSDHFYEEEKRMKDNLADARMYGWIKLWRSDVDAWNDVWGCLEKGVLSFYYSADTKQNPVVTIDMRTCTWKIHNRAGVEKADVGAVKTVDLPYIIEIKINVSGPNNGVRMYMITPDLPSKQRWLAAFKKAIPEANEPKSPQSPRS